MISKVVLAVLVASLVACRQTSTESTTGSAGPSTTTTARDSSMAESAGEAGLRARKKAEALKAAEDARAKETDNAEQ